MSRGSGGKRLHRTWPQRLLITFNVCCIVAALLAATSLAYAKRKVGEIDRVVIGDTLASSSDLDIKDPRNFLIVGADSDDGLAENDPAAAGRDETVGGIRSDTIMIVRLDPSSGQAKVLSFPRDLWVDIPGNSSNRINSSLQFGGPDLLIDTIKANFDIDINHYVQINFAGFQQLVKLIGGVPVWFDTPVRDTHSGLLINDVGCTTLDENGALSYVRARHFQHRDADGDWTSDATSDLARISRQQDFMKRVMARAISQGARNPGKLADLIDVGVDNITLDEATTPGDLVALGRAFKDFDPNALETYSLPVDDVYRGGAAVLDLRPGEAEPTLALFRGTGATDGEGITPASVAVQVLNGSGKQDQASDASNILATAGFTMTPPSEATPVGRTEVRYQPGMEAEAALVARHLFADPVLIEDIDVAQVTVVTGEDFGAAVLEPRPVEDIPIPTTTTTTTTTVPGGTDPGSSSTSTAAVTTTTTSPLGYLPGAPPAGQSCG